MESRWGRRVYGRIEKGPVNTHFHVEITLDNGCTIYRGYLALTKDINNRADYYKAILDDLTRDLDEQVKGRIYTS